MVDALSVSGAVGVLTGVLAPELFFKAFHNLANMPLAVRERGNIKIYVFIFHHLIKVVRGIGETAVTAYQCNSAVRFSGICMNTVLA